MEGTVKLFLVFDGWVKLVDVPNECIDGNFIRVDATLLPGSKQVEKAYMKIAAEKDGAIRLFEEIFVSYGKRKNGLPIFEHTTIKEDS
jgi:hypothetical protein